MKVPVMTTHCEFCDAAITLESPPSHRRYENAEIHVKEGTVLLPEDVVKRRHVEGVSDGHAESIDGYYCNPKCLAAQIDKILNPPARLPKVRKTKETK